EAIFIDGTKIEANANKFTFVWRKSIERYQANLIKKSNALYEELVEKEIIPEIERESPEALTTKELQQMATDLDKSVQTYTEQIESREEAQDRKVLRSERKQPKQALKKVHDFIRRKEKYEEALEILEERNSYSKTDHDATFMRLKDDHMKNGQLKAAYNVQLATEGRYALAYDIFPNPTDTRTWIPFLDRIEKDYFALPDFLVADAAYGSEQNIENVTLERLRTALITYNMYRKEKKKKYKKNPFNTANWDYDAKQDAFTCPNGQAVTYRYDAKRTDKYGYQRQFKVYECEDCTGCPLREQCTKAKEGNNRKIFYNGKWEAQKKTIREQLSDEEMGKLYGKRKIDVEPFFGFLKANLGFTRFSVRGKPKVENELGFALMAVNLRRYAASSRFLCTYLSMISKKDGFHIKIRCEIHLFIIFG
ncbi:IS1182 family transposase, partial [Oceanobacillus oncorhynchi]|uniref:IS1182 family transposase n=1 Tax=Oceanobacillus oncorhynchi TaxID=545501 RepID=UPI0018667437